MLCKPIRLSVEECRTLTSRCLPIFNSTWPVTRMIPVAIGCTLWGGGYAWQRASVRLTAQATGVEPGSPNTVTGARPVDQDSGSRATSTSGRTAEDEEEQSLLARITAPFKQLAMRGTVYTSFIFAKQPKRIRQVSGSSLKIWSVGYMVDRSAGCPCCGS